MTYQLDRNRAEALRRLLLLAHSEDPGTIACLERIGVASWWACLEVGAGAGTIAQWLAGRVGSGGRIVATDIAITMLEPLAAPPLEILQHDVVRDELETDDFDLVHARQVLMHLPEREAVLARLAAAVKPAGWLLVEDTDAPPTAPRPPLRRRCRRSTARWWARSTPSSPAAASTHGSGRGSSVFSVASASRTFAPRAGCRSTAATPTGTPRATCQPSSSCGT